MFDILNRGGGFMWLILVTSIISITLIIERTYVLWFRYKLDPRRLLDQIKGYLDEGKFARAIELCEAEKKHPLAQVLKAGLLKADESERRIQRAMETAASDVMPVVTKRVNYLQILANFPTLLGLLGTIVGLIEAFKGVAVADAAAKQEILSKGISVAMFTTAFGLIGAIPSVISYAVLQNRQNALLAEIENRSNELFNHLADRNQRLIEQSQSN